MLHVDNILVSYNVLLKSGGLRVPMRLIQQFLNLRLSFFRIVDSNNCRVAWQSVVWSEIQGFRVDQVYRGRAILYLNRVLLAREVRVRLHSMVDR